MEKLCSFIIFLFGIIYVFNVQKVYGINNVNNFSFEENTHWEATNSNITFTYDLDNFYDGVRSAKINNTSTTTAGIEQIIPNINPNQQYVLNGYIKFSSPPPTKVLMRVAWYASTDGSGSQISTADSNIVTSNSTWEKIEFTPTAPSNAHSAKIRLFVTSGSAYFDSIYFDTFTASVTPTISLTLTPTITISETISPTISQPVTTITPSVSPDYSNIFISEVMVYPEEGNEWIEIVNGNDFKVDLVKWYIDDEENSGGAPKEFSVSIEPHQLVFIDISSSMFNNTGDSVRLLNHEKIVKDSFEYSESEEGKSLGKNGEEFCIQESSKGLVNTECIINEEITPTTKPTSIPKVSSKTTAKSSTKNSKEESTSAKSKSLLSSSSHDENPPESETPLYFQDFPQETSFVESTETNVLGISENIMTNTSPFLSLLKSLIFIACSFSISAFTSLLLKINKSPTLYYSWKNFSK
jgi:hypothetical protein